MLSIQNVVKQYAGHRALSGVSFDVAPQEIFGLLGPNGAGKTSLIRIINQITKPDSGRVLINAHELRADDSRQIGYLPEERGLFKKMVIEDQLVYLAQLKGIKRHDALNRIKYWCDKLNITAWKDKKLENLSKGMQQKVQFIAAVIHQPSLIILDEPFSGFDPVNADAIKTEILELNRQGTTFIISTHRMESVDQLCNSFVLMNKSHKVLEGNVSEVKNQYKDNTYRFTFDGEDLTNQANELFILLKKDYNGNKYTYTVKLNPGSSVKELVNYIITQPVGLTSFQEVIPSMHEIFVNNIKLN